LPLALAGAGLVLVLALPALGFGRPAAAPPPPPPEVPPPVQPVAATVPACPSIASWLEVIATYERQARWSLTTSTTQTALRTPGLCADDRSALAQKLVAASREALFEEPPAPEDAPGQRRVTSAYVDLKSLARGYGLAEPAPLAIARTAYDQRLYLLAATAYTDAFTSGAATIEDREVVRADYAAQRNIGLIWAQRTDPSLRQDGLARLATACRIQERQQLASPEACDDLRRLVGTREKWPAPLTDPLLDAPPAPVSPRGL
jgi:hypothetical protein